MKQKEITCIRCGYTWTPRKEKPVQCPGCKRRDHSEGLNWKGEEVKS